jgi:formylglycine-generating enzyme required for sulfatase activity
MKRKALKNVVFRALRSGSYLSGTIYPRSSERGWVVPELRVRVYGFRLVARKVR